MTTRFASHAFKYGLNLKIGLSLTIFITALGLLANIYTPHPIDGIHIAQRLSPPGSEFWLGSDRLGRDLLSMLMKGASNALLVGSTTVGIGLIFGVPLGLYSALKHGIESELLLRFIDLVFAFPAILTAILIAAIYEPGLNNAIIALGIFNIAVFARITHGATINIITKPYIQAAQALGQSRRHIITQHILPNAAPVIGVQATTQYAIAILAEAGLSYLGLGVQPPDSSWGSMLKDAQTLIYSHPSQALIPGSAIVIFVLGLNLLGDGLRDYLDPYHQNRINFLK